MLDGDPPLPEIAPVLPEELQRAAMAPDAPAELRAVAAAVRVGRTSWAVIAAGTGEQVPEVRALYEFADHKLAVALGEEVEEPVAATSFAAGYYRVILVAMKTAVSMPDDTFEQATRRARELGMSRSEFLTVAARRYLDELDAKSVTEQVNQALTAAGADDSAQAAVAAGRRALRAEDDW